MPKYDAFGREIGEDTFAGLGGNEPTARATPAPAAPSEDWTNATTPTAEPADGWTEAPAPEPPVIRTPGPPPQRIKPRRTRGLGCLVGLVVLAAIGAGPVIAIVGIVDSAEDAFDSVTGVIDRVPSDDPVDEPAPPPDPPAGIAGRSMIAPDNVGRVLRQLERDGVKRVGRITVWPDRLGTDMIRGRRATDVTFSAEGGITRGEPEALNDALGTVTLAAIDAKAPARLVRNSAKRYRVRERGIDYVIGSADIFNRSEHRWVAYFKNGVIVEGDARGRIVRRID